ncbi:MAG: AAA family ATPase [Lachnospiraceae bacterium]|nr:AAA family ATPase [Lachnospiraceae bacterium]
MNIIKRKAEKKLEDWYRNRPDKHLYVTGLRGTGKSTLIRRFADSLPDKYIYIDFETDNGIRTYFREHFNNDIISALSGYTGEGVVFFPGMILILDEIHMTGIGKDILASLSALDNIRVILIDSEGVTADELVPADISRIILRPLTFDEFLDNTSKEWYKEVIIGHYEKMRSVPSLINNEIKDIFDDYLTVGGMPDVVNWYTANDCNITDINELIRLQLKEYRNIIRAVQEAEHSDCSKMTAILEGIIGQDINGNRHFAYGRVVKGSSGSYYTDIVNKMVNAGLICRSRFEAHFRLFWADTGLLNAYMLSSYSISDTDLERILNTSYLAQQLTSAVSISSYTSISSDTSITSDASITSGLRDLQYWCSENSSEIDQIAFIDDNSRRLAVKYIGASKKKVRSLQIYSEQFPEDNPVAVGDVDFNIMGNLKLIPQYAVFCLI